MGTTAQKYHGEALLHDFVPYMKITLQGNHSRAKKNCPDTHTHTKQHLGYSSECAEKNVLQLENHENQPFRHSPTGSLNIGAAKYLLQDQNFEYAFFF